MIEGFRVVVVTPAGRRETLSILWLWMGRCRGLVDEWRLWENTSVVSDLEYINYLVKSGGGYVTCEGSHEVRDRFWLDGDPWSGTYTIHPFFLNCVDSKTIYIRLDDDIVYVTLGGISELLRYRLENRDHFLVSGNVINNSICSHIHQRFGFVSSDFGLAGYDCFDEIGWKSGAFALEVHRNFLRGLDRGVSYNIGCWLMGRGERLSINCICWFGHDFAEFGGNVGVFEEDWLTVFRPGITGQLVSICGGCVVSHYAYGPQREFLSSTGVLDWYRTLALRSG